MLFTTRQVEEGESEDRTRSPGYRLNLAWEVPAYCGNNTANRVLARLVREDKGGLGGSRMEDWHLFAQMRTREKTFFAHKANLMARVSISNGCFATVIVQFGRKTKTITNEVSINFLTLFI